MLAILVPRGLSPCLHVGKRAAAADNRTAARTRDASVADTSRQPSPAVAMTSSARSLPSARLSTDMLESSELSKMGHGNAATVSADDQPSVGPKGCDQQSPYIQVPSMQSP
jgi:hypothetical protein